MTPYWVSPVASLYLGDAAVVLRELPAESVDMCVTSPPFWGLRDYRVDGQIGLEKTPGEWLEHILAVFREVRRVLRPWGTCWIEIGDSYAGSGSPGGDFRDGKGGDEYLRPYNRKGDGLKPLDLVGIPFRLALALQAEGWWLRSVIIWHKPAPMPESVAGWRWVKCKSGNHRRFQTDRTRTLSDGRRNIPNDRPSTQGQDEWADCPGCPKCASNDGLVLRKGSWRPTEAHSYILMLAKGVPYYANGEAVREAQTEGSLARWDDGLNGKPRYDSSAYERGRESFIDFGKYAPTGITPDRKRNLRSVWRIGPEPSSLPHFATFPTGLPEKCILAGTSEWGNCPGCGMPWAPVIETKLIPQAQRQASEKEWRGNRDGEIMGTNITQVLGWRPTCQCGLSERVPPVVLDPFVGTGTSCVAAQQLGRRSIGVDLNPRYLDMAVTRLGGVPLPLEEVLA